MTRKASVSVTEQDDLPPSELAFVYLMSYFPAQRTSNSSATTASGSRRERKLEGLSAWEPPGAALRAVGLPSLGRGSTPKG